jgi:MFS family permease
LLGITGILIGSATWVFATLALMGVQGALMSPSRNGCVPETVRADRISAANGVLGMATVMAAVVGSVLGNTLYVLTAPVGKTRLWLSSSIMLGIALLGAVCALFIDRRPAADPDRNFPSTYSGRRSPIYGPWSSTVRCWRRP